jgi:hypothetical protein
MYAAEFVTLGRVVAGLGAIAQDHQFRGGKQLLLPHS